MGGRRSFISVIIPVFNGAAFLPEAVESIRSQAVPVGEIIIVDDGSTDDSAAVANSLGEGIRYAFQPNQGPHAAQNTGLEMARGNVIAFLDADDRWSDRKLSWQLPLLEKDPGLGVVLGFLQFMRLDHGAAGPPQYRPFLEPFLGANCFGAALFRQTVFAKVGRLDAAMAYGADVDWFLRAREQGLPMAAVDGITLHYRLHPGNLTRLKEERDRFLLRALKQSLDRRTAAAGGRVARLPGLPRPQPCCRENRE